MANQKGNQGDNRGGNQGKGRGSNLTQEDRAAGGRNSAGNQRRDEQGQFIGKSDNQGEQGPGKSGGGKQSGGGR